MNVYSFTVAYVFILFALYANRVSLAKGEVGF